MSIFHSIRCPSMPSSCHVGILQKNTDQFSDIIPSAMASQSPALWLFTQQFTHWGTDQRKHYSSAPVAFVRVIHRGPVNFPHKGPVTRKCFHLITSSLWDTLPGHELSCMSIVAFTFIKFRQSNSILRQWIDFCILSLDCRLCVSHFLITEVLSNGYLSTGLDNISF